MAATHRRWGGRSRSTAVFVMTASLVVGLLAPAAAESANVLASEYDIVFPVAAPYNYSDSWGAPRSGGRTHQGIDIFAAKGTPVVAVADGTVTKVSIGERAGRYIVVRHNGGWRSYYLHLDNDTPGTDDGLGGAPADGIVVGAKVKAGDILDFVGDSGNAEETPSHLHFEIRDVTGFPTNPYPHLRAAEGRPVTASAGQAAATPRFAGENVRYVGNLGLNGGFAADIEVHDAVAYIGTWGRPQSCPASGVRMIDVADPSSPVLIGAIATGDEFSATSTDSLWVGEVETSTFSGDLAVAAVRLCDTSEGMRRSAKLRGLALYDVSDSAAPTLVGTYESGPRTQGVHEIDVVVRENGTVLAAVTVLQSHRHSEGASGDLRIIDITDPGTPIELADWDFRRDAGGALTGAMAEAVFDDLELHAHSATWAAAGNQLWVANWDAGIVLLDTADPAAPLLITTFGFDPDSEGNAHSVAVDADRGILVRSDQDLVSRDSERHSRGWSGQRIYDISDLDKVIEVASFTSPRAVANEEGDATYVDGRYSAHSAVIEGDIQYAAWYSDGVRIVDLTNPADPVEVGWFIPPASIDPQRYWQAPDGTAALPMVWGVTVTDGLMYVSDMNTGLWIMEYTPPRPVIEYPRL